MPPGKRSAPVNSGHALLLEGLLVLAVVGFFFFVAWRYGLLARVWYSDPTGISVAITLVFLAATAHGSVCLLGLSGAFHHLAKVQHHVLAGGAMSPHALPEGCVRRYIQDLQTKARLSGTRTIDQALLLETFEADLRRGHLFSRFISDLLLSLGLLGTVIGLVLMLGPINSPISGPINAVDGGGQSAVEGALAVIGGGMAVALYTTLAGLIGGALLKIQGFLLDRAVDELVRRTAGLTEAHVLPPIERMQSNANV